MLHFMILVATTGVWAAFENPTVPNHTNEATCIESIVEYNSVPYEVTFRPCKISDVEPTNFEGII